MIYRIVLLCWAVTFVGINRISGETIDVCSSCTFTTVQEGVGAAKSGDVVLVKEGIYKEHEVIISKAIRLIAKGMVVLDGENTGTILQVSSDSVTVEGFKFINVGQSYTKDFCAIRVYRSKYFSFINNTLENVFFGIMMEKSHYGIISKNTISSDGEDEASSGNGIHAWHCSHLTVIENTVHNMRDGIYFEFVSESTVAGNNSYNNIRYGLHFMFSNKDEYYDNIFMNNGAGVAVMFSKYIKMHQNTFKDNWGPSSYGLLLKEIYDAEIIDNDFIQNTTGINAEGSTRINYTNNNFSNNGWALKITGACYENIFSYNNFLNNSFDLSYNGQLNDNKFTSNYWSSYSGYDLDRDGIGDVPFRPVKLFSYIVNRTPETIVLLRSLFVDIINFSERVSPVFTPDALQDSQPLMKPVK